MRVDWSMMEEEELKKFNIRVVYDLGYSWSESELIIRKYCEEQGIDKETCDKLLSMREPIDHRRITVHDPPLTKDDSCFS
jgi:hypothetical protein